MAKRESHEGGGSKGKEGVGRVVKLGQKWVLGLGNGCSQVGTSYHNGAEGQGQSQNRVAREICQLGCLCNGDICDEP